MLRKEIAENYPFISLLTYGGNEYVGIIINQDPYITSILDYSMCKTIDDKKNLLELGEIWWMESNRQIPITIFLRNDVTPLRYCIKNLNTKDVNVVLGPIVSVNNLAQKRVKRKNLQLVRKPKK